MAHSRIHSAPKAAGRGKTKASAAAKGTAGKDATRTHAAKKKAGPSRVETSTRKTPRTMQETKRTKTSPTVHVDRRRADDRRTGDDRRKKQQPVAVDRRKIERRAKVSRRRQIDPTTCERDYTPEELEFMSALDEYKRTSGRMFPTCSEILEVITNLGYRKPSAADGVEDALPATGA